MGFTDSNELATASKNALSNYIDLLHAKNALDHSFFKVSKIYNKHIFRYYYTLYLK